MPYGAHGYGAAFTLSVMDRDYFQGLNQEEALTIMHKCIQEIQTRFLIAQPNFVIKVSVLRRTHRVQHTSSLLQKKVEIFLFHTEFVGS